MKNFPVGYRRFHPDESLNYELNRWLSVLPEAELTEMAPRMAGFEDWRREMSAAAERAERDGRWLAAAFFWRAVEFFLDPDDEEKLPIYERFASLFERALGPDAPARELVPFEGARLPAVSFGPPSAQAKETVLLHGGFDSFMEELYDWGSCLAEAGYRVVLFEGPGQGAVLRRDGLPMRPEWERPVAAILDHFAIPACTIVGISLGGYLAPRAAAFEPRIRRVVACDVLDDFFDCFAVRGGAAVRLLGRLTRWGLRGTVDRLVARASARDPVTAWAMRHGMHVCGASDPYEFVAWLQQLATAPFADRIHQDFLLLAGTDDHIVPLHQFYRQARNLPNVRSFTGRVFGPGEHAAQHCQIGNVGLVLRWVVSWLDFQVAAERDGLYAGAAVPSRVAA